MVVLPDYIKKYFWGDDLNNLNWEAHKDYIAKTILDLGDRRSVRWLRDLVDDKYLLKVVREKKISARSKNFWNLYLS